MTERSFFVHNEKEPLDREKRNVHRMEESMIKWIKTHQYCLTGLYLFVFLFGFFLLEVFAPSPKFIVHSVFDDWIPFNEWFVIPYFFWYLWVPLFLIFFMIREKEAYLELCFIMFAGATLCLIIYILCPTGLELRGEITKTNLCSGAVRLLRRIDPPQNVCPSIHVSSTVAIHLVVCRSVTFKQNRKIKMLSLFVTLMISISTLFIKQHSVIDVLYGWIVSGFFAVLTYRTDFVYRFVGEEN